MRKQYLRCKVSVVYEVVAEPNCNAEKVITREKDIDMAKIVLDGLLRAKKYDDVALRTIMTKRYTLVER